MTAKALGASGALVMEGGGDCYTNPAIVAPPVSPDPFAAAAVAPASNGAVLPQATINVYSTARLPAAGTLAVAGAPNLITYTGKTPTTLTGCSGGTGTLHTAEVLELAYTYLRRVSESFPAPTLVGGIPQNWTASSKVDELWGRFRIVVMSAAGAEDVTFLRGTPAVLEEYIHAKPYGPLSAKFRFPQISFFDTLGAGDLSWLVAGAYIQIQRVHPDESFTYPSDVIWDGLIEPVQHKRGEELTGTGAIVTAIGVGQQLGFYRRAPGISNLPYDIGQQLRNEWSLPSRPHLRTLPPLVTPVTAAGSNYRGNWETALEFLTKLSEESLDNAGLQWLNMVRPPRQVTIVQNDMVTPDWHASAGAPGILVDLSQQPTTDANVIYGESVDQGGQTLRNMYTDGEVGLGVPFFQPLAYDPAVHPIDANPDGSLVAHEARLDLTKVRQESYMGKGQGISYAELESSAQALYAQLSTAGWSGTVTYTADPEDGSRFSMKAGENHFLRYFDGTGVLVQAAQVKVTVGDGSSAGSGLRTEVTADSKARNLPTLMAVIQRQRDLAQNPVKRLLSGKSSGLVLDRTFLWDGSRSGWVPNGGNAYDVSGTPVGSPLGYRWAVPPTSTVPCPHDAWTLVRFLASQTDTIVNTQVVTAGAPVAFVVAIFDQIPDLTVVADPTAPGADVLIRAVSGYQVHWGNNGQLAGYSPGLQSNGDPLTGVLEDQATWSYKHSLADPSTGDLVQPAFLWMAIWPVGSDTEMWAQLTRLAN